MSFTGNRPLDRRRLLRASGAALAGALAGCPGQGGDESTPSPTGTPAPPVFMLTDYADDSWVSLWRERLIPAFESATGIGVRSEFFPASRDRLRTLVDAGDWPDLNTSTFGRVCALGAHDEVEPLTDVVERARDLHGELVATPATDGSEYVQAPHGYRAATFLYRTDVYERLGLAVPTSFEEVLTNARAIDESGMDIRGYGLAGSPAGKAREAFQAYLARMGVPPTGLRWEDPSARSTVEIHFPRAEVEALLSFFGELAAYSVDPGEADWRESVRWWLDGGVAQQFHANNWAAGVAARLATETDGDRDLADVAEATGVAPLPYWRAGGVTREQARVGEPALDAFHLFEPGGNAAGGRRWLEWLYADDPERTARLYAVEPTRYVPNYADLLAPETYRGADWFDAFPGVFDQLRYVQETIVGDHYGQRSGELVDSPVGLYVGRQPFYGEMVRRVATGTASVGEAYEFGRTRLEARLREAEERT